MSSSEDPKPVPGSERIPVPGAEIAGPADPNERGFPKTKMLSARVENFSEPANDKTDDN